MAQITRRDASLLAMLLVLNGIFLAWPRMRYDAVVVHHTASHFGDYRSVRRDHHARGWAEIAYHAVLSNGSTQVPFGHLYPTWRYRLGLWSVATRNPRFNVRALHLSVVGDFEESAVPADLERALGHALSTLMNRHGIPPEKIFLHRDCSATACPGQYVDREKLVSWLSLGPSAAPGIQAQHREAFARFGIASAVSIALWLMLNGALLYTWAARRRGTRRKDEASSPLVSTLTEFSARHLSGRTLDGESSSQGSGISPAARAGGTRSQ